MVYINADGSVSQSRTVWRWSIITDFLWAIFNTIGLFVNTLVNPGAPVPQIRRGGQPSASSSSSSTSLSKRPGTGSSGDEGNRRGSYQSFQRGGNIKSLPKQCTSNK
jgi:hypothetical protein